ncbi:MAG: hypothetical protein R6V59_08960 [Dehalococcoidia bacterium]
MRHRAGSEGTFITPFSPYLKGKIQEEVAAPRLGVARNDKRKRACNDSGVLLLRMPAKQDIVAEREAKPCRVVGT